MATYYPDIHPNPDFAAQEKQTLDFWQKENVFQQSVEARRATIGNASNEYIFYDGPPFANGLPHYGHLLTGFVKDAFARYQTMKGKRVERRFGWDCHGLPAEMGSEKELGISGRAAITAFGIDKFNAHCRTSVMKYTHEWERYVNRQARWVDFSHDYKTMDIDFMESVLWAFKQLYDKGLVYEAYRVMPYSWAAETPLSNFETKLDNSYREREDKAITVAFELIPPSIPPASGGEVRGGIWSKLPKADKYYVLAWTTTPWTLPSNLALAVNAEMKYIAICHPGASRDPVTSTCYIIAKNALPKYATELGVECEKDLDPGFRRDDTIKGSDLIGLSYRPLFPYFASHKHAFKIIDGSNFVTDGDGTGIVHIAPGFGEDDQKVAEANGITLVVPVDEKGRYTDAIFDLPLTSSSTTKESGSSALLSLKGLNVIAHTEGKREDEPFKEEQLKKFGLANLRIIHYLKNYYPDGTNRIIKEDQIKHNYPHCWRTDQPLIYRAMPSWYVEVTKFRDRAVQINQQINWIPAHIRDGQMGHMLATAPDWSISRNRFWGTPIPVWRRQAPGSRIQDSEIKVFGSIAEMEDFFDLDASLNTALNPEARTLNPHITDLHRPFIDQLTIAKDGSMWKRVEDVFDCWFESGSMPFAQVHYPFENKDWFEAHFPADFITEYVGQTRGWFNTLIMLSTALFDKPPFKNCICHGVVLDEETGLKYSKRLKNYKDPMEVFDAYGSDALRWMMLASPVMRGQDIGVDPEGKFIRDVVRLAIKPFWNAYNFFCLYANADNIVARESWRVNREDDTTNHEPRTTNLMDRYILAKCKRAVKVIETSFDEYDSPSACEAILEFFDVLNNWYIRRNKERFWKEENDSDKQAAYDTLYTVLHIMCRAAAPLLPLTTEEIYRGLTQLPLPAGEGWGEGLSTTGYTHSKTDIVQLAKARDLRGNPSDAEQHLWYLIRNRQLAGAKFKRQQPINQYIVDFCCHEAMLIVELDGGQHATQQSYDSRRDDYLREQGYEVIRFWNNDVLQNTEGVLQVMYDYLERTLADSPSPQPSPGGRGSISVHLEDFPDVSTWPQNSAITTQMDWVRDVCNAALAIRNKLNIRVRQPLQKLQIISSNTMLKSHDDADLGLIITSEINVKDLVIDPQGIEKYATLKLSIHSAVLGKILPEKMKQILPASKKGEWKQLADGKVEVAGVVLPEGSYALQLEPKPEYKDRAQALSTNDALVILDTTITPELEAEGIARDVVRMVQQARKDAGFHVSDRIALVLNADAAINTAITTYSDEIAKQTLAVTLNVGDAAAMKHQFTHTLDEKPITIGISVAA